MGVLSVLSDLRYSRAVESYTRVAGKVNAARAGTVGTSAAAVARAAQHSQTTNASAQPVTTPEAAQATQAAPSMMARALGAVGRGVGSLIALEQSLTAAFGKIPFPSLPALRGWDLDIGLPHAHNHPPNLIPPSPVPIPLPSMGPVIPIPLLSGASKVLINGVPAARCGDMGLAIFCGGFFPMFEIFLGSANVWVEGARASRVGIDITKHCTFSSPKPSDPPLGPMIGTTIPPASPNVVIGGIRLPSLFSLAVAQFFKAAFKIGGAAFRKATAKAYVNKLIAKGRLALDHTGAPAHWAQDMLNDLYKIASSRTGRQVMNRIDKSGRSVTFVHYSGWFPGPHGPAWSPHNAWAAPASKDGLMNMATGVRGAGSDAIVSHNPAHWANHPSGGGGRGLPRRRRRTAFFFMK